MERHREMEGGRERERTWRKLKVTEEMTTNMVEKKKTGHLISDQHIRENAAMQPEQPARTDQDRSSYRRQSECIYISDGTF